MFEIIRKSKSPGGRWIDTGARFPTATEAARAAAWGAWIDKTNEYKAVPENDYK